MSDSSNLSSTRADVARENGAKSQGPVTREGKSRSSQNSTTHSLTASKLAGLNADDQREFNSLHQSYGDLWHPANIMEETLVKTMVVACWQEQRCLAIETALFAIQMQGLDKAAHEKAGAQDDITRQALAFMQLADESKALSLLLRYRNAHLRNYDRAMRQLIALRSKGIFNNAEERNEPRTEPKTNTEKEQPLRIMAARASAAAPAADEAGHTNPSPLPSAEFTPQFRQASATN